MTVVTFVCCRRAWCQSRALWRRFTSTALCPVAGRRAYNVPTDQRVRWVAA